jgi:hypothetical protein
MGALKRHGTLRAVMGLGKQISCSVSRRSRRTSSPIKSAPTDVGGYTVLANQGEPPEGGTPAPHILPQQCLYFLPLWQGQGSLRPTFGPVRTGGGLEMASAASVTMSLA